MKLVVCRVNSRSSKGRRSKSFLLERMLFVSCVAVFAILIGVQGLIMNPSMSAFLSVNNELDGTPLGAEEILYKQGQIEICMANDIPDDSVKVLLNGEEAGCFSQSTLTVRVKDGDVVEVDGSNSDSDNIVYVKSKSDSIQNIIVNKNIKVGSKVIKIGKINIE